jgi:hypothetical protein
LNRSTGVTRISIRDSMLWGRIFNGSDNLNS